MARSLSLRSSFTVAASFVALLWLIHFGELIFNLNPYPLSIYPRSVAGLPGIVTGPLLHASWQHLAANSLPTLVLGSMLIYAYPRSRLWAFLGIWLWSGLGVWLFARSSYHLGVSGITHGIFFYLFVGGILRRDKRSAAILMLAFYLYGGMVISIFPTDPAISFESHFFGALAGGLCAYLLRNRDPKPQQMRYGWQRTGSEMPEEEDPVIGDQWKVQDD